MVHKVQFIHLEENDNDLIVSFAIADEKFGVKSLTLIRTIFFEELLDEAERGVKVSLEGEYLPEEDFNVLESIEVNDGNIKIKSTFKEYELNITALSKSDIEEMMELLKKQNYDNRFSIYTA